MQKILFSLILLFGIIGVFYYIAKLDINNSAESYNKTLKISGEDEISIFKIDEANNPIKRELGLSYRKSMCADCGMFFTFPKEDFYSFWMKDMYFDIDIIFINSELEIVNIFKDIKKEGYDKKSPGLSEKIKNTEPATYVLEINAGQSEEKNLKFGDKIILD